jgi:hypothetical protein
MDESRLNNLVHALENELKNAWKIIAKLEHFAQSNERRIEGLEENSGVSNLGTRQISERLIDLEARCRFLEGSLKAAQTWIGALTLGLCSAIALEVVRLLGR